MKNLTNKSKIVMINSFKGGAGKTSLALSHCVTAAQNSEYSMVYYLDVDLLGTGSVYTLLNETDLAKLKYLNEYTSNKHSEFTKKVCFIDKDKIEHEIYVAIIDPDNRIKKSYSGKNIFRSNEGELQLNFLCKIIEFINQILKNETNNLIVLDCSPGLSTFEVELMHEIYNITQNKDTNCEFKEIYVSTFDDAHINKTIDCLSRNITSFRKYFIDRNISLVINDVHNCKLIEDTLTKTVFGFDEDIIGKYITEMFDKKIVKNYKEKEYIDKIDIIYRNYEISLCASNIINNRKMLSNNSDAYYINSKNYRPLKKQ